MLDLDLRVCMNGGDVDCEVNFKIFNNTRVPKRKCDWSTGFVDRGKLQSLIIRINAAFQGRNMKLTCFNTQAVNRFTW